MYNSKTSYLKFSKNMEIHSSSLAFIPAGYNAKNKKDESQSSVNKDSPQALTSLPPPKKVKDLSKITDFQELSNEIKKIDNKPSKLAVNAYIQQNIEPLKNQRAELAPSIDLFA